MGDYKTVAAVTRAIAHVLREALTRHGLLGEVDVTIASPHQSNSNRAKQRKTINLFLYHVRPTPSVRNRALPVYDNGQMVNVPEIGLDLYYLLSFYGTQPNDIEAERLLGLAVAALNAHPLLDQQDFIDSADPNEQSSGIVDSVAISPMTLTIEEMQRLWTMFPQVPYTLSMSYCASTALLISDGVAEPQLPVAHGGRRSAPETRGPIALSAVANARDPERPIVYGDTVRISGQNLLGSRVAVELGEQRLAVQPDKLDRDALELELRGSGVRAGQKTLRVLHLDDGGALASARVLASSNSLSVAVHPRLRQVELASIQPSTTSSSSPDPRYDGQLHLKVSPKPGLDQRVGALLNLKGAASAYAFLADPNKLDGSTLPVDFRGVLAGNYLVRYEVDGVASLLRPQSGKTYSSPRVRIEDHD